MSTTDQQTETGPDGSPRQHWTSHHGPDGVTWRRHTWPIAAAGPLAEAFAAGGSTSLCSIVGDSGAPIARLISENRFSDLQSAQSELQRLVEGATDDEHLHPAIHGPNSGGDRFLLDTDEIREAIAHAIALINLGALGRDGGITRDEVTAERERILADHETELIGAAVEIGSKIRLLPDTRGVVPVRCWANPNEATGLWDETWTLAYVIEGARGLYLRPHSGFFADECDVVTGAGYKLRGGFLDREIAAGYARAVAAALPGLDWRIYDSQVTALPDAARAKLIEVNAAWTQVGPRPPGEVETS